MKGPLPGGMLLPPIALASCLKGYHTPRDES